MILGGGFGGVRAALYLNKKLCHRNDIKLILIDKNDAQSFTPALYEIASIYGVDHEHPFHGKFRGAVCIPYKDIFRGKNIELVQADISHIDLDQKHVVTSAGNTLEFEYLVIALGTMSSTFGVPGADEYAYKFKTIEDGLMVNDKIENLYLEASQGKRGTPINILIVGAGFNGIELAAELSNCAPHIAHRHKITKQHCVSITILEAGPFILPMISEKERHVIETRLGQLGINVMVNTSVEEIGPDYVKSKNGSVMKSDLIIWSAGVRALDLFKKVSGLELDERGRIFVDEYLRARNHEKTFVVGDNLILIDPASQRPIPQMAYLAIEQGRVAAENIVRLIEGRSDKLIKYKPGYNFWIAPLGGKNAVAHLGKWGTYHGFLGYLLRQAADLRYFLSVLPFWRGLKLFCEDVKIFSKND